MQIFKLQIFIRRKDFFIALHLIEPISAYLLCWPKSPLRFFRKIKDMFHFSPITLLIWMF